MVLQIRRPLTKISKSNEILINFLQLEYVFVVLIFKMHGDVKHVARSVHRLQQQTVKIIYHKLVIRLTSCGSINKFRCLLLHPVLPEIVSNAEFLNL